MNPFARREAMTIFVVFFGISVLDAVTTKDWWRVAFWLVIAAAFAGIASKPQKQ
jgi:hypothetical protein